MPHNIILRYPHPSVTKVHVCKTDNGEVLIKTRSEIAAKTKKSPAPYADRKNII